MSTKNDLPRELIDLESRLQSCAPAAAKLDRDETLFQSGWAAAETSTQRRSKPRRELLIWRGASAVLAASVALLAMPTSEPVAEKMTPQLQVVQVAPVTKPQATARRDRLRLSHRELALRAALAERPRPAIVDTPLVETKSVRELLGEYLERERSRS